MDRKPEIERELLGLLRAFSPIIYVANDAYQLSVSSAAKRVEVVWPYPLHEVFFDFWDGDSKILSESFEFYEGESDHEFIEYMCAVLNRFLNNSIRLYVQDKLFKITELQFSQGGVWQPVF